MTGTEFVQVIDKEAGEFSPILGNVVNLKNAFLFTREQAGMEPENQNWDILAGLAFTALRDLVVKVAETGGASEYFINRIAGSTMDNVQWSDIILIIYSNVPKMSDRAYKYRTQKGEQA